MNEEFLAEMKEESKKISAEVAEDLEGMDDSQALAYLTVMLVRYTKLADRISEEMIETGQHESAYATLMYTQGLSARIAPFVIRQLATFGKE